jgi:predicted kinase
MSSQDVLELIALDKASVKSEVVHVFVLELLNQISLKNTNFSKEVGEEVLKRTWNEALVAGLSGEDKRIVKEVIITVQKKLTSNNGRNIVLLLINKTVLDILEVAA